MVGVLSVTETISWGVLFYAFSVVLLPMAEDLGAGRGALAGAWSSSLLVAGVAAPLVGARIDRRGGRGVMTTGAVLGAAGVWWWSAVTSLPGLYGAFAVIGIASAMVLYEPAFAVIARAFDARERSAALLVLTVVAGFAATIFLPMTTWLVGEAGWRGALRWLALLLLVTTAVPHALAVPGRRGRGPVARAGGADEATEDVLARGPAAAPVAGNLGDVLRDRTFWWLTAAFVLGTASVTAVSAHMVGFLVDRGETAAFAAAAVGSLGAIKVGGRIVLALSERRAGLARLMAVVFASQGAALALLALTRGRAAVVAFVAVYGAGFGAATIARPLLVVQRWGTASYGAVAGAVAAGVTVAKAASPVVAGTARDALGSTTPVLLALAALTAAAGLCLVPLVRGERGSGAPSAPVGVAAESAVVTAHEPPARARSGLRLAGGRRRYPGVDATRSAGSSVGRWRPHSVFAKADQRPARSSSPSVTGRVHGAQPTER